MQEIPNVAKFCTAGLAHVMKMKILFRGITATGERSWTLFIGLVLNDIDATNALGVMFDEDDNALLEGVGDLDDELNLNTHTIDDIPTDLDVGDKGNKKVGYIVQSKKRKKGVQIVSQHLSHICDVIESKSTMTSKSYDKLGCSIEKVIDVIWEIVKRENDIDIIRFVTDVFFTRSHIEMFVTIKEPWL
jgi:hypothetical protein